MSHPHYLDMLFSDNRVSKTDLEVMWRLRSCSKGFLKEQRWMVDWTGKDKATVSRSLSRLISLGYVIKDHRGWVPILSDLAKQPSCVDATLEPDATKPVAPTQLTVASTQLLVDQPATRTISNLLQSTKESILILEKAEAQPLARVVTLEPPKKKTRFDMKTSITKEGYQELLSRTDLANGDRQWLYSQIESMQDWSANGHLKQDWLATARNWIKRARKSGDLPKGAAPARHQPKTFKQIDDEEFEKNLEEFRRMKL